MSQRDDILIYAELLSNVRRVSVACDGPLFGANAASASVSADSLSLTVRNHEIENTLQLPDRVVAAEDAAQFLRVQNKPSRCYEWSLPLAPPSGRVTREAPRGAAPEAQAAATPWTAQDLVAGSSIRCRGCQTTLVAGGKIETWKDLPSENWAEMMEFWHCHKPHDHEHHDDHGLASRGYGANSRLSGQEGVGLVDLNSLLFSQSDCSDITVSSVARAVIFLCIASLFGSMGSTSALCQDSPSYLTETFFGRGNLGIYLRRFSPGPDVRNIVQMDYIDPWPYLRECDAYDHPITLRVLQSHHHSLDRFWYSLADRYREEQQLLHIWLFNQDITFTSTNQQPEQRPVCAVKVFYRFVNQAEADKLVESMTSDVQDITLPAAAATQLREELEKSNGYLPKPMRNFAQWRIGLLEKWKGGHN
ncbi:uncharacterized protein PG998_002409 [Apiospora kogelbergensis]|uniref:uncharacterized protein n=1 Tax=Apiospora kogelbergensis TaxID=1337665 RepID=UPI00312FB4DA